MTASLVPATPQVAAAWPEDPHRAEAANATRRDAPNRAAIIHALRLALGIRPELHEVRDWREVLRAAVAEKIAPLAWVRSGAAIRPAAPVEISAAFRSVFVANAARVRSMLAASRGTIAVLERQGISPIVLKGPPLAARLYADSAARICSDLDWFVPAGSLRTLHCVMEEEGWARIEGERYGDPCYARHSEQGPIYLEVHSSLLHERYGYLPLPSPVAARAIIDGVAMLAHDDSLLPGYLSVHLATHRRAPLAWLIDLLALWDSLGPAQRSEARGAAARARVHRYLSWALGRATLLRRAATGDAQAANRLGIGDATPVDQHPMWRHIALAPGVVASAQAVRSWVVPSWVSAQGAGWVPTLAKRIATHWRNVLPVGGSAHGA